MADNLTTNNNLYTLTPQLLQKNTYKTHYNCLSLVSFFIGSIVGGGMIIFSIYTYLFVLVEDIIYIFYLV